MREWIELADLLKEVRSAERDFLGQWATEEAIIRPGLDRVAADITGSEASPIDPNGFFGADFNGSDYTGDYLT